MPAEYHLHFTVTLTRFPLRNIRWAGCSLLSPRVKHSSSRLLLCSAKANKAKLDFRQMGTVWFCIWCIAGVQQCGFEYNCCGLSLVSNLSWPVCFPVGRCRCRWCSKCWGISKSWRVTALISLWQERKPGSDHSWMTFQRASALRESLFHCTEHSHAHMHTCANAYRCLNCNFLKTLADFFPLALRKLKL